MIWKETGERLGTMMEENWHLRKHPMLAADVRQSIELFFYYYANGTLAWAELNATEYRAVTASNPELFWKSCAIFIHHLLNKDENPEYGAARWLKAQLTGTPVIRSTDAHRRTFFPVKV
jgi:hypothetical protein